MSSSVRWSVVLAERARMSKRCGRQAEGMQSRRLVGGGEVGPSDKKRMTADVRGLAPCSRTQSLQVRCSMWASRWG